MKYVATHYWSEPGRVKPKDDPRDPNGDANGRWAFCRYVLHDPETDESRQGVHGRSDALERALIEAGVQDGDEFEIVVRKTGRRPFGDRRVVYTKPHTYEREPNEE